ncbi:hypothetical protein I307_04875 [Cryptococcus deuterogattii 99/473]|uniref:Uncharacterized protein n=1 Tax=Cryptococcus deuterogattii Ram5 TaxID=1296110 RepID=A0A0D0V515_9TREE|nr:hypothetical protein I309_03988 [Cryptococcus deuterogattii LA55]KIR32007.1 hypothetical protein I352_05636 [Cryptococcus deuterogattii MMRL2647]KIR40025.1 hypothetical protein I313_03946 [Cryptococcus deuterogattii Ram5]KIR71419.1 hypothetical protein I310_04726 [Cryptococcus deuterogattii CA1014]KIR90998.1 hypothetical protein I304_05094 [Cryptococcus deuterogattii CBS 10090]KIY55690.1 hypothetical protein I307_04875 [Cryptococcus deuterogattii 99/473]
MWSSILQSPIDPPTIMSDTSAAPPKKTANHIFVIDISSSSIVVFEPLPPSQTLGFHQGSHVCPSPSCISGMILQMSPIIEGVKDISNVILRSANSSRGDRRLRAK